MANERIAMSKAGADASDSAVIGGFGNAATGTFSEVNSGGGGLLNAEQSDAFIDYMWDETVLAKEGRRIVMSANEVDIDKLAIGTRVVKGAVEAGGQYTNEGVTFTKVTLSTVKVRLDWEVSTETNEDAIEGNNTSEHIARVFAAQAGNDIEDLAINADGTTADGFNDVLYNGGGFKKRLSVQAPGNVIDWAAVTTVNTALPTGPNRYVFDAALRKLPRKYKANRGRFSFYAGPLFVQDYLTQLTNIADTPELIAADVVRGAIAGPQGEAGRNYPLAFGVPIKEVPLFPEDTTGTLELTYPENRLWGIKRDIRYYEEFQNKKDTTEYTMFMRWGVQIENADAYVEVQNVALTGYPTS